MSIKKMDDLRHKNDISGYTNLDIEVDKYVRTKDSDLGFQEKAHRDSLIKEKAFIDAWNKASNIVENLDTKKIHSYMKFGHSDNNYVLVRSMITYNFHVIPEIDVVSVTKIVNSIDNTTNIDEVHTLTVEDARNFYINLRKIGFEEL